MSAISETLRTVFLLATALVNTYEACQCGRASQSRVIGGGPASVSQYPWMTVLLVSETGSIQLCGASLISSRFAVTAYHCTHSDPKHAVLLVGRNRLDSTSYGEQKVDVKRFIQYKPGTDHPGDDDIALIEVAKPVKFGSFAQPICLPPKNRDFAGVTAVFLGFGATVDSRDSFSYQLKEGKGKIPSNQQCKAALRSLGGKVTSDQICAGTYNGAPATCYGDSGGPLMYYDPKKKVWELIGVVAQTYSCSDPRGFGLFTRISKFVDWIKETTHHTSCQK